MGRVITQIGLLLGNMPIRRKLGLAFSILVLIPILGTANLAYMKSRSIIESKTGKYTQDILSATGTDITLYLDNLERLSILLFTDNNIQNGLKISNSGFRNDTQKYNEQKVIEKVLFQPLISRDDIDSIYIISNSDNTYSATSSANSLFRTYSLSQSQKNVLRNAKGGLVWLDTDIHNGVIPMSRAIYDIEKQRILGYLVINIKEASLYDLYEKLNFYSNGHLYIINNHKNVVSSPNKNILGQRDYNPYINRISNKAQSSFFTYKINNKNYYISFRNLNINNWIIISVIPAVTYEHEVITLRDWIAIIAIILCLLSFIISYILSENISKPIRKLSSKMVKVQEDNYNVKFTYKYSDEIGILSENFNQMVGRINYLIEEVYKEQLLKQQSELKSLRMQINPHFLYNTLESINWMARVNGVPEVGLMAKNLGDLMRYTISGEDFITLGEEIKNVEVYLALQKCRFKDKFQVEINVPTDILSITVPKLLLQPIIENSIVHGLELKLGNGIIKITGYTDNNDIIIILEDDGVGIEPERLNEILDENEKGKTVFDSSTIGLLNINRRIKLYYGKNYGISISSRLNEGTKVIVKIPLDSQTK